MGSRFLLDLERGGGRRATKWRNGGDPHGAERAVADTAPCLRYGGSWHAVASGAVECLQLLPRQLQVFLAGCFPTPNMAFLLVDIKNHLDFII